MRNTPHGQSEEIISTRPGTVGVILCQRCNEMLQTATIQEAQTIKRNHLAAVRRRAKDEVLRDMGLTKVRGALGGIYWE